MNLQNYVTVLICSQIVQEVSTRWVTSSGLQGKLQAWYHISLQQLQISRCELLNQTSIWDCQENMAESHLGNITTVNLETSQSRGIVKLQMSPPINSRIVNNNMEAIRNQEMLKRSVIKSMLLTFRDIWTISCIFSSVMWCHRGSWH